MMWFGWGMFMGPLFFVGIALLIYYLVKSSNSEHHSHHDRTHYEAGRAIEILKERYVKGEITKEQFKEMRRELDS